MATVTTNRCTIAGRDGKRSLTKLKGKEGY